MQYEKLRNEIQRQKVILEMAIDSRKNCNRDDTNYQLWGKTAEICEEELVVLRKEMTKLKKKAR